MNLWVPHAGVYANRKEVWRLPNRVARQSLLGAKDGLFPENLLHVANFSFYFTGELFRGTRSRRFGSPMAFPASSLTLPTASFAVPLTLSFWYLSSRISFAFRIACGRMLFSKSLTFRDQTRYSKIKPPCGHQPPCDPCSAAKSSCPQKSGWVTLNITWAA